MLQKFITTLGIVMLFCLNAMAQFYPTQYRPPVHWQQLKTDHFEILYPQGEDSTAWNTARILEIQYPKVQKLTGGSLSNFPVILTNYNDRSNGRVTSLHFRSEIDIPPIKGKTLNPKSGGWLDNVVPHELVHALQFSNLGDPGLGQLVNLVSPDLARSIHSASASGIQEGLATYYESELIAPGGGRGNYPFFYNQFNAVFDSPGRWSMGQMVQFPEDTRPFNRHYIGGFEFTNWLQDTYGLQTSRDAIDFHIRWPFLGYGIALKHATGQWPSQLFNEFEVSKKRSMQSNTQPYKPLVVEFDGPDIRRPKWLSNSTLVFYGSFYNAEPGFYRYNLKDHTSKLLIKTGSVSDYNYTLSKDKKYLIYSYYRPDILYPGASKATLVQTSLANKNTRMIVPERRLFDPAFLTDSSLLALETYHSINKMVGIDLTNHSVKSLFADTSLQIIAVTPNPMQPDGVAVIINKNGQQSLWLSTIPELKNGLKKDPAVSFNDGSIFDPVWHPSGKRILFSADFSGTLQVYEYEISTGQITQLTHAPYNAFEASYSPDGNRIAFIAQKGNERLPVVINRDQFDRILKPVGNSFNPIAKKTVNSDDWQQSDYSTGVSWLKPRTLLPEVEEIGGSSDAYEWGLGIHSSDLLQQQAYSLAFTTAEERLWYDLSYRNKQFFPGFKARIFSDPGIRRFRFVTQDDDTLAKAFLRQERSFALSVPMQFTLQQNVTATRLYLEPEIRQSQLRFFSKRTDESSNFSDATIGNVFAQFNYKVQQNVRDVQPNSGMLLYSELEHSFTSGSLQLPVSNSSAGVNFSQPTALRGGVLGYFSPLKQWNQSLRIGFEGITQTSPVFDNQSVVSNGFSESVFPFSNNLLSFSTRYTFPLIYPDNGGLLLPLYLSNVYLAGFTNTVTDLSSKNIINTSRSVCGAGLRFQFRISNLSFDIGAGISLELSRNKIHYFIGNF